MTAGVRERARHALRSEIAEAMSNLFADRGFDMVTVEEAAREVGISRATFFRYFGSKEDAVIAAVESSAIDFAGILAALPSDAAESPWQLLHRTFGQALDQVDETSEQLRARLRMINTTMSLRARMAERRFGHEDALTRVLEERISCPEAARPVAAAALAGFELAWRRWSDGDESSLRSSLDHVFGHIATASAPRAGGAVS